MRNILRVFSLLILVLLMVGCSDIYKIYEVTDIDSYGDYSLAKYGKEIEASANEVLPTRIETFFTVEKYSFKYCNDPMMHEIYLEITINDEACYQKYVGDLIANRAIDDFYYDSSFKECVVFDSLGLQSSSSGETDFVVAKTNIQKILFSEETNTIIFVSFCVPYDDMPFNGDIFVYFDRFNIDIGTYYGGKRIV